MVEWPTSVVAELEAEGVLKVEDGNHGEYRPRRDEFVEDGVAFIRAADMAGGRIDFSGASKINEVARERIRKGIGAPGDVLLSHKGTVGRVAVAPPDAPAFVCSPQTTFWRTLDDNVLDRAYLRYFLESPLFTQQLDARKGETDMAAYVSLTEQRRLVVTVPPIGVQQAIGSTLGALDDKIESNRHAVRLCATLARTVLDGSERRRVSDVATLAKGLSYKGAGLADHRGLSMVNLANFGRTGWLDRSSLKHYTGDYKDRHIVRGGDLVIANTDLTQQRSVLGRPALVPPDIGPCLFTHHVYAVRFLNDEALALPLWAALNTLEFRDRAEGFATGTTVASLPKDAVLDFEFSLPDHQTAVREAEEIIDRAWAAERESDTLAALRDALLPELLSGRLRVPEAEDLVAEVT